MSEMKTIQVKLKDKDIKELKILSKNSGLSLSAYIRMNLRRMLKKCQ